MAKENRDLRKKNEVVKNKYNDLVERFNSNVRNYNELLEENTSLKARVKDLTNEIGSIYKSTKEFLKERTDGLKAFKNVRSEEHTSELQSRGHLVCRLLLEKKKNNKT